MKIKEFDQNNKILENTQHFTVQPVFNGVNQESDLRAMCFVFLVAELGSCNGWLAMCEDREPVFLFGQVGVQIIPCWRSVNVCSWLLKHIHSRSCVIQDSSGSQKNFSTVHTSHTGDSSRSVMRSVWHWICFGQPQRCNLIYRYNW